LAPADTDDGSRHPTTVFRRAIERENLAAAELNARMMGFRSHF
jgi:hypothetical protein